MNGSANVQSVEAIELTRTALAAFANQVDQALVSNDTEMRRVVDWLSHDCPRHWKTQVRLARDGVGDARKALNRCLMYPIADERPSCREERAALKKAEARLAYCEEKVERVKHWNRVVQHEILEYDGRIRQLVDVVETDVPQAIGVLNKLLRRIEEYQAVRLSDSAAAYDDQSLAKELWPAGPSASEETNSEETDSEETDSEETNTEKAEETDGQASDDQIAKPDRSED